ncbi:hypothetical protein H4R34_000911 [Dimargaris verticillata]|uniref:Ras-GEF domain-containing protein n=1 Tax=Dimargaris verticillata TaxID=2761393 RepID=A0A9W8EE98_9FUNG|nr:hypothetical protein H4R34_000911 [Dimargaris verticillata]
MDLASRISAADRLVSENRITAARETYITCARECLALLNAASTSSPAAVTTDHTLSNAKHCIAQLKHLAKLETQPKGDNDGLSQLLDQVAEQLGHITKGSTQSWSEKPVVVDSSDAPLVPISPLTQVSILYAHSVATAAQQLAKAKRDARNNQSHTLAHLRRILDNDKIQRDRLAYINKVMGTVAQRSLTAWGPDQLARHLTLLDARLFARIDQQAICPTNSGASSLSSIADLPGASNCLDLYRYLHHTWVHELLLALSTPDGLGGGLHHVQHTVCHVLEVARCALTTYRNANAYVVISQVLADTAIQALVAQLPSLASTLRDQLAEMNRLARDHDQWTAYRPILNRALAAPYSRNQSSGDSTAVGTQGVYAIPCLALHARQLESIRTAYSSHQPDSELETPLLSAPGVAQWAEQTALLSACRGVPDGFVTLGLPIPLAIEDATRPARARARSPRAAGPVGFDLSQIAEPDLLVHHWLLTRPYLTTAQLGEEARQLFPSLFEAQFDCTPPSLTDQESPLQNSHLTSALASSLGSVSGLEPPSPERQAAAKTVDHPTKVAIFPSTTPCIPSHSSPHSRQSTSPMAKPIYTLPSQTTSPTTANQESKVPPTPNHTLPPPALSTSPVIAPALNKLPSTRGMAEYLFEPDNQDNEFVYPVPEPESQLPSSPIHRPSIAIDPPLALEVVQPAASLDATVNESSEAASANVSSPASSRPPSPPTASLNLAPRSRGGTMNSDTSKVEVSLSDLLDLKCTDNGSPNNAQPETQLNGSASSNASPQSSGDNKPSASSVEYTVDLDSSADSDSTESSLGESGDDSEDEQLVVSIADLTTRATPKNQ